MNQPDLEDLTWAAKHPQAFRQLVAWSLIGFAFLAGVTALRQEPKTAPASVAAVQKPSVPTKDVNASDAKALGVPDPCALRDVVCPGEKIVMATVTTYQATWEQTDSDPCHTANGANICPLPTDYRIVANNCLAFGTHVRIRGYTYVVSDRMSARYGCDHFDVLTSGYNFKLTNEPIEVL